MKCPGNGCPDAMSAGQVACSKCIARVHPKILARLAFLKRDAHESAQHVTLVASVVRWLAETPTEKANHEPPNP